MNISKEEFEQLKLFLDSEAERINSTDFIANDPVQFPRRFERIQDIEIAAFLCATIAWGNRKMICNNCHKMLALMDNNPLDYTLEQAYEDLPDRLNLHRTFFAANLKYMLRGLRQIFTTYGTLNNFAATNDVAASDAPAWRLVELMQQLMRQANTGKSDARCLPSNLETTALKRVNMALRWLVRDDGIVDMGVWNAIPKSKLFIPLDVHVGQTARQLGLLERKANDRKAVMELTVALRLMRPDDPAIYDFALFGIGIGDKYLHPTP